MRQKPSKKELKEFIEVYEEARKDSGKTAVSLSDAINTANKKNDENIKVEELKKIVNIVVNRENSNYVSDKPEITVKEFFQIYRRAYMKADEVFNSWNDNYGSNRNIGYFVSKNRIKKSKVFGGFFDMNYKKFDKQREHLGDFLPLYLLIEGAIMVGAIALPYIFAAPFFASVFYISYINIAHVISRSRRLKNLNFIRELDKMIRNDPNFGNTIISVGKKKDLNQEIVENLYDEFEKMKSQK